MTPDADLLDDRIICASLPRSWGPFFGHHGRLREIQRRAIPRILAGQHVLLSAPTASGKTEAVAAPLAERALQHPGHYTVLYVSPTRALVNDLYERLHEPLRVLNIGCVRRTSEHKDRLRHARRFLITTPESTDSLLCRGLYANENGHILASVEAIVLDEVHLLFGTPRGEQLRWLLLRLEKLRAQAVKEHWVARSGLQRIGLSATIQDLPAVGATFMPAATLIEVGGAREIETVTVRSASPAAEEAIPAYIRATREPEKILVFCNSKRRVDELATYLRPFAADRGIAVHAHHAGLGTHVRHEAERAVRALPRVLLVATSTLEIGIDIGDIDVVVLDGPPPDIPALLQRIGRGNRRRGRARVIPCAGSFAECLINWAMIEAARDGWLGECESGPSYGVAWQQVLSYVYQSRNQHRFRKTLLSFLTDGEPRLAACEFLDRILDAGDLVEDRARLRLSQSVIDRANRGDIHSTIEGGAGLTVVDENGVVVAKGVRAPTTAAVSIGGRALQVKKWSEQVVEVRTLLDETVAGNHWGYYGSVWMHGAGQPQALRRYLGIEELVWPVVTAGDQRYAFHFGGARRKAVLWLILKTFEQRLDEGYLTEWYWVSAHKGRQLPEWVTSVSEDTLLIELGRNIPEIERQLARPKSNVRLPTQTRLDELRGWLQIRRELDLLRKIELQYVESSHVRAALRAIVESFS